MLGGVLVVVILLVEQAVRKRVRIRRGMCFI